ncbi:hypothetical protein V6Z90_004128 [Aspergillus fumigatus]
MSVCRLDFVNDMEYGVWSMEKRDMLHYIRLKMMTGLEAYIIGGLERNEAVTEEKKYRFKGGEKKARKKRLATINRQSASSSLKIILKVSAYAAPRESAR